MTGAIQRGARIVEVHSVQRGGESIGVTLAANLTVADNVDTRTLHLANRDERGVILRLFEERLRYAPDLPCPDARWQPVAEVLTVDEPFRLRKAAHDSR